MSKVFSFNEKGNGSYICEVTKVAGTPTACPYSRTEKGLAILADGSTSKVELNQTISLGTVFSFACVVRVIDNSVSYMALAGYNNSSYPLVIRPSSSAVYIHDGTNLQSEVRTELFDGNWHHVIITRNATSVYFYIDNVVGVEKILGSNNAISIDQLFQRNDGFPLKGYCGNIEVFDHILSSQQRQDFYEEFLDAEPVLSNKFPKYGMWDKPTNDDNPNALAHFNFVQVGGKWVDITNNGNDITVNKAMSTFSGVRLVDHETIGNIGNVKTIAFRIKLDSTSEKILEGDPNAHLIYANVGTLTYPDFDNAFVDGVDTNTVVADQWHNIVITSSTNVNMTDVELALNNTTAGNFEIADLIFIDLEAILSKAVEYHNPFAKFVILDEKLEFDSVGSTRPRGTQIDSGSFGVKEDVTSKYLECTASGDISYVGIDLSSHFENGWIKQLDGDLSGDAGGTVDDATNVAFANGKVTITMTTGQKVRNVAIQQAGEQ